MADSTLGALTEDTAPLATDFIYKVAADGTTDRKVALGNLANPAFAVVSHNAVQSIPASTWTACAFAAADTEDTNNFHDPASNNTRLTIPTGLGGRYLVTGRCDFAPSTAGERGVAVRKNGTTFVAAGADLGPNVGVADTIVPIAVLLTLVAGDYIEMMAFQGTSGALNINSNNGIVWHSFAAQRVSA